MKRPTKRQVYDAVEEAIACVEDAKSVDYLVVAVLLRELGYEVEPA